MLVTGGYYTGENKPSSLYSPTVGWTAYPPIPVETTEHHCQVTIGDTTFIAGGWTRVGKTGATYKSTNGGQWVQLTPMLTPRKNHACVEWDGKILAIGGDDWNGSDDPGQGRLSIVESYDTLANKWSLFTPLPKPMKFLQAVAYKGLYVLGGESPDLEWNKDVYQLRPGSYQWQVLPGVKVEVYSGHGDTFPVFPAVVFNNLPCKR